MIKLIDLNFHMHDDMSDPMEVLSLHRPSLGFVKYLKEKLSIQLIKHMNYEGVETVGGVQYFFFRRRKSFWSIPLRTLHFIRNQQPHIVLVQGFIFPLQVIALRLILGKKTKVLLQYHGEKIFHGPKLIFQRMMKFFVDGWLFTSAENANHWIVNKIIPGRRYCYEVLEGSTHFCYRDKEKCRNDIGMRGPNNFLWVGRLNDGKDPLCVLDAFEKYIRNSPAARLYMIFQTDDLMPQIQQRFAKNRNLEAATILVGKIQHDQLRQWYCAADFFVAATHAESTGYSLIEAMACGCVPVVTAIPSYKKITANGELGFLFEVGNSEMLYRVLMDVESCDRATLSEEIIKHFYSSLSFRSIADQLYSVCSDIITK